MLDYSYHSDSHTYKIHLNIIAIQEGTQDKCLKGKADFKYLIQDHFISTVTWTLNIGLFLLHLATKFPHFFGGCGGRGEGGDMLHGMQDVSSPIKDWTHVPRTGSVES